MAPRTVILDCDPGTDDAVALLLALASPEEIALEAITVVGGNVGLERTVANTLALVELARAEVPVFAGAARPLLGDFVNETRVHGESGLRGADLPPPSRARTPGIAADRLRALLRDAAPRSVTLVAIGPLTNLALAFATEPACLSAIREIAIMGGAIALGNVTPAAEFNIYNDPEAAGIVFASGVPITLVPLDLTHQALATAARIEAIRAAGTRAARTVAGILSAFPPSVKFEGTGFPVHDPCAVAWLIRPDLMSGKACHVAIDTTQGPSRGRTVIDWWGAKQTPNAMVLNRLDADGLFALLAERLARLP